MRDLSSLWKEDLDAAYEAEVAAAAGGASHLLRQVQMSHHVGLPFLDEEPDDAAERLRSALQQDSFRTAALRFEGPDAWTPKLFLRGGGGTGVTATLTKTTVPVKALDNATPPFLKPPVKPAAAVLLEAGYALWSLRACGIDAVRIEVAWPQQDGFATRDVTGAVESLALPEAIDSFVAAHSEELKGEHEGFYLSTLCDAVNKLALDGGRAVLVPKEDPKEKEEVPPASLQGQADKDCDALKDFLRQLSPDGAAAVSYLDFETTMMCVPGGVLAGKARPFQQIPVQFSLHVDRRGSSMLARDVEKGLQKHCDEKNAALPTGVEHYEWLHLRPEKEDRRGDMAAALVNHLCGRENSGPVVVWNAAFERRVITGLAEAFPQHRDGLLDIEGRLLDLRVPFSQKMYVDPGFRGSSSLKKVLPVLCPNLGYGSGQGIEEGASASGFAYRCSRGLLPAARVAATRPSLIRYCRIDTAAMLAIASALRRSVGR